MVSPSPFLLKTDLSSFQRCHSCRTKYSKICGRIETKFKPFTRILTGSVAHHWLIKPLCLSVHSFLPVHVHVPPSNSGGRRNIFLLGKIKFLGCLMKLRNGRLNIWNFVFISPKRKEMFKPLLLVFQVTLEWPIQKHLCPNGLVSIGEGVGHS